MTISPPPDLNRANATDPGQGPLHESRRFGAHTAGDAITAITGVGIPTLLVVGCWLGSNLLAAQFLTVTLTARWGLPGPTAWLGAAVGMGVFLVGSWARLMCSDLPRVLGNLVCTVVVVAWLAGAVTQSADLGGVPPLLALLAVAWCVVGNWAAVKLARPGKTNHHLYRFFNRGGKLLYVGITNCPRARFGQHAGSKDWWGEVATREITFYPTRVDLEKAEKHAIRWERPLYNVAHNGSRGRRR